MNKVLKHWKYDQRNRSKDRTYQTEIRPTRVTFSSSSGMQNKTRSRQRGHCVSCGPSTMIVPSNCQQKHREMAQDNQTGGWCSFIFCPVSSLHPGALFEVAWLICPPLAPLLSTLWCSSTFLHSEMLITALNARAERLGRKKDRKLVYHRFLTCTWVWS